MRQEIIVYFLPHDIVLSRFTGFGKEKVGEEETVANTKETNNKCTTDIAVKFALCSTVCREM